MKALYKNPIAIILAVLSIGGFVFFEEQLPSIDLSSLEPGNVIAMLGYISVVMLVVEQCIEVFIDDPNQKVKKQCKDRIEEIEEHMETIPVSVSPAIANEESEEVEIEADEEVEKMMKEKKELENILMVSGQKRHRRTTLIAFIIGLVLSFSGIRLISGIIFNGPQETLSEIQFTIIQSIDVILTAGIIAGGSGRMHRLLKRVKEALGQV
ncbi:hypothetical protein U6A24_16995 [Aquimarina gracilis]|uniref:MotA/TolQ/ExbB proton channel domain-containing protein n=1 Tax=Aquimarina gracilis TaxID=874422 RepID=A0ABU5ZZ71_9FLAO|nr:hypothetical protein [Aquimarina gracilis]MEB3347174.1 hypothetical protein [Aquimarina gracilis]